MSVLQLYTQHFIQQVKIGLLQIMLLKITFNCTLHEIIILLTLYQYVNTWVPYWQEYSLTHFWPKISWKSGVGLITGAKMDTKVSQVFTDIL